MLYNPVPNAAMSSRTAFVTNPGRFDHTTFLSPFSWRYGTEDMRRIWSQHHQRLLWRRVWTALAETQAEIGLISAEQAQDIRRHMADVDLDRALAIEAEIRHDLMAELRTFAEQCPAGGGVLHLGATSADIQDNADALRLIEALDEILGALKALLADLADRIETTADVACIGYTHIQPAEPTTLGYRLAQYGQDLLGDWHELTRVRGLIRGKGIKGAVGTGASYAELLGSTSWTPADLERGVMARLGLEAFTVTTQIYPRKQDWLVANALAGIGASLGKFALDLRVLQSPPFGEWAEPFREKQVGSSAMPFKRNPITAEKINSLARYLAGLPRVAWDNAALSILERTLDDSANRRVVLPEAFLTAAELLEAGRRLVGEMRVDTVAVARNLAMWGVFSAVERVLMQLAKRGADRQQMHERLREYSMRAWAQVNETGTNPLGELLVSDPEIVSIIEPDDLRRLLDASEYVGDAPRLARVMATQIRQTLE